MNLRNIEPSEQRTFGTSNLRNNGPSEQWTFGKASGPPTLNPQLKIEKQNNNNSWINVRSMLAHRLRLRLVHIGLYRLVATRLWGLQLYVQKVLCSEGPMFRRFYVQKVLCSEGSMFRKFYVQKVLYSEGSMFRRSYVQKDLFRRSYG